MSGKRNDVANALAAIDKHYAEHRLRKQHAASQSVIPQSATQSNSVPRERIRYGGLYRCCIQTFESTPEDKLHDLSTIECVHCHSTMVRAADGVWEWQSSVVGPCIVKQEESAT